MISQSVLRAIFAGLAYLDENLTPQLDLASSYRVSDDFKTYIFFLRDCTWSDGSPISARDFEETWKSALTPAYTSGNTNLFYFLKNGKKAFIGAVSIDQVGVHALDDKTLVIELEEPNPCFLNVLVNSVFFPVHESMRYTPIDFKHVICSGPFQMDKYIFQDQIVLKKNPLYWQADKTRLNQIQYLIIKDPETTMLMFEKGEIDWLGKPLAEISPDAIPHLKTKGTLHWIEGAGSQWLFINTKKFPYGNVNIRKALAYAIDRTVIMQNVMHLDNPSPPLGVIPKILKKEKWHPWFKDNDKKQAQAYFAQGLKELGITAAEFPRITLTYANHPVFAKFVLAIQQMWTEVLGISVNIEGTDAPIFMRRLFNADFEIARSQWVLQYNDPSNLLDTFKLKNMQPNFTGWEDSEYVQQTNASYLSKEQEKWDHIEAAEKIFFEEMPAIPVADLSACYLIQPYLKDVRINHLFQIDFRNAYIEN